MKNKKWIWWTLTILLTLVVLAGVGGVGFRMGLMQSSNLGRGAAEFPAFGPMHRFERNFNDQGGGDPHMMRGFGLHSFGRRHGGFFSPLFGILHLILLGVLLWLGFKLIKNSGWRITRVAEAAPAAGQSPSVEEKQE